MLRIRQVRTSYRLHPTNSTLVASHSIWCVILHLEMLVLYQRVGGASSRVCWWARWTGTTWDVKRAQYNAEWNSAVSVDRKSTNKPDSELSRCEESVDECLTNPPLVSKPTGLYKKLCWRRYIEEASPSGRANKNRVGKIDKRSRTWIWRLNRNQETIFVGCHLETFVLLFLNHVLLRWLFG